MNRCLVFGGIVPFKPRSKLFVTKRSSGISPLVLDAQLAFGLVEADLVEAELAVAWERGLFGLGVFCSSGDPLTR